MEFSAKQLGVYALIAIFILSTVAIYFGASGNSSNTQQTTNSDLISGYATAQATLSSYDPTLEIRNATQATLDKIKELKSNGAIIQNIKTSSSTLLTLSDSKDVPKIASELQSTGAIALAQATVTTGKITFVAGSETLELESFAYRVSTQPVFLQGEKFPITFSANVLAGEIYAYSSPTIVPSQNFRLQVIPIDVKVNSSSTSILIPFENRALNLSDFENSTQSKLNYSPRSYITFATLVPDSILQQLSLQKLAYITSLQPTSFSIAPDFTDINQITQDLEVYALEPQYPPSTIFLQSENNSALASEFLSYFNNTNASLSMTYSLDVVLPESINYNEQTYFMPSQSFSMLSQYAPTDDYVVTIEAQPVGNRIASYSALEYGPATPQ